MPENQGPLSRCPINEILPDEILGAIFEEHAKLEWRAPVIDGRVCRLWRQIILSSPRAWAYLELKLNEHPRHSSEEFVRWLRRSGAVPLHIRITPIHLRDGHWDQTLYPIIHSVYNKIASLRMRLARLSFFSGQDFPCLRLLDVQRWTQWDNLPAATHQWGSMPRLRFLRLGATKDSVAPLDAPPLRILALYDTNCISLARHSRSLTSLSLQKISYTDTISGQVAFPSLTYLSLYYVGGLKPHINAPCLATYHEGGSTEMESFSAPLHSLLEYGVEPSISGDIDITRLHDSFPNITRITIRSYQPRLISFVAALAQHPDALPAVQTISAEGMTTDEGKKVMEESIRARSEACQMDITLHFTGPSYKPSLFFSMVSHASRAMVTNLLTYITESRIAFLTTIESRVCHCLPSRRPTRRRQ
jgi:hypothetical protein